MRISYETLLSLFPEARILQGSLDQELYFSLDSRTIKSDEIFIPFKGLQVDGHSFVKDALVVGKGAFISYEHKDIYDTSIKKEFLDKLIIMVHDPVEVLIGVAAWWRSHFTIPVIGITGSVGKTSTKLLVEAILKGAGMNAYVGQGNQNTVLGIALNIARLTPEHACAVFELGISKTGEMKELVEFVQPTIGVITAIGHSHLEGLGTVQDVATEKKKIFSFFNETNIGIINGDSPLLSPQGYNHPVVRFGKKKHNQVQARSVSIADGKLSFVLKIYQNKYKVSFDTTHESYVYLVLAAVSVAYNLGIDERKIVEIIQQPLQRYRRFEKKPLPYINSYIIDDAYNASPESTRAALIAFDRIPWEGKKIVVFGDMKELGEKSLIYHRKIARLFFKLLSIDQLILVGNQVQCMSKVLPKSLSVASCTTLDEAQKILDPLLQDNMLVLFKASFGMNFIQLVNHYSTPYKQVML